MTTLIDALVAKIRDRGRYDSGVQHRPACVLWTDKERMWEQVVPSVRRVAPDLLVLGAYDPEQRQGTSLWIRAVLDGCLPGFSPSPGDTVPIVYLPGWSRSDLRAIASCPSDLRFLAEFQYRGAFFAHPNGRDWTPLAFLSASKQRGGLGLEVGTAAETKEALELALGELLDCDLAKLEKTKIDSAFLHSLVVSDLSRDVLEWLGSPNGNPARWNEARHRAFYASARADLGWKPEAEGPQGASARLIAAAEGSAWVGVWDRYLENPTKYPKVYELLRAQKPKDELFVDHSRYPSENERREEELRKAMLAVAEADPAQSRQALLSLEAAHGARRGWAWAALGKSDLALALKPLAELARLSAEGGGASDLVSIAQGYQDKYWRIDAAAMEALEIAKTKVDREAIAHALRAIYLPWVEALALQVQHVGLVSYPSNVYERPPAYEPGTCILFVDALRYDLARRLLGLLEEGGTKVTLSVSWSILPTVTSVGKYAQSPALAQIQGMIDDGEPVLADEAGHRINSERHKVLLSQENIAYLRADELGTGTGRAWTEIGEIDNRGHDVGSRLALELPAILARIVGRVEELLDAGWARIRLVTDHGWLLMPGGLQSAGLPASLTLGKWGRSGVLAEGAPDVPGSYAWKLDSRIRLTSAPGARAYLAGREYAHGGLSVQEAFLPSLAVTGGKAAMASFEIVRAKWMGLRCEIEIRPPSPGLVGDIRLAAMKPETSVVAAPKQFRDGKVSLPVVKDDKEGHAASIVVLDEAGAIVAQENITIGG